MALRVWEEARLRAEKLRKAMGISSLPVDPFFICAELGIDVHIVKMPDDVSGMIVKSPHEDAKIFIAASDSAGRQRFTCAHELGHFIDRIDVAHDNDFSFRDLRSGGKYDLHEFFADEFAGALLMPAVDVDHFRQCGFSATEMAVKFGVSPTAVVKRLNRLERDPAAVGCG
jgi:Zn-dependent peptidase ImmA (M78 family)